MLFGGMIVSYIFMDFMSMTFHIFLENFNVVYLDTYVRIVGLK